MSSVFCITNDMEGTMSIFDSVKEAVASCTGSQDEGLLNHTLEMVNSQETGGVQGLVQQFHEKGLGDVVNSWVGPGGNHPVTADQIEQVLGRDRINAIASKFGMSPEDASAKMAAMLPTVVDKLTPHGSSATT